MCSSSLVSGFFALPRALNEPWRVPADAHLGTIDMFEHDDVSRLVVHSAEMTFDRPIPRRAGPALDGPARGAARCKRSAG